MAVLWVISASGDEAPARAWAEGRAQATYVALSTFVARHPYLEPDDGLAIWIGAGTSEDQAFVVAVSGLRAALAEAAVIVAAPGDASVLGDLPPGWVVMAPEVVGGAHQQTLGGVDDERAKIEDAEPAPRQTQQEAPPPESIAREEAPRMADAPGDEAARSGGETFSAPEPSPAAPSTPPTEDRLQAGGAAPLPAPVAAPAPQSSEAAKPVAMARKRAAPPSRQERAPADATAFAPKRLRRATPELVRIAIHQPKDLQKVIDAAKKADKRAEAAGMQGLGDVALGASVGVALDVHGAACDGALKRQTWTGAPLEFPFVVEAESDRAAKQAVIVARIFIDDAEIGMISFTRPIASAPSSKPAGQGERARLKRHKRVFLSYSSDDRETVAAIAVAYESAGVEHFFDRTSLKSGEEWHPRLLREIDRSDLFHLCWSKAAARSQWVAKEAEHALTRKRRSMSHLPNITVQMLDGPPWARHPDSLDALNFDDFTRAAIVGYARGDGT